MDAAIRHATSHQPRSLQQRPGPSDLGCPCDRKLGYQLAKVPRVHWPTAWYSYLGVAGHAQLASDLARVQIPPGFGLTGPRFLVEQKNLVGQLAGDDIDGTSDLYDRLTGRVLDWKFVGNKSLKRYRVHGPPPQYKSQIHIYGKGWWMRGLPITDVVIAFLPRTQDLSARWYWHEPYDEQVALDAFTRAEEVNEVVQVLGREALPLLSTTAAWCESCPYFLPGSTDPRIGCPGDFSLPTPPSPILATASP
ncbi:hypothetical protein [Nonomuraea maheshkhaliensis]|uniref:hypothetical protein n=1 Tax=Nonomuraea maheshkhaliensis TaxID=419590 RepID=UPI0031F892EB